MDTKAVSSVSIVGGVGAKKVGIARTVRARGIGFGICIGNSSDERSKVSHSPVRGVPGGDLCAFGTMSRRAYPVAAGTTAGKQK